MTTLDEVDRGLIHALHIDGRAPFNQIGAVLGVSTQTIARRYRRLRAEAGLRVVGIPDAGGIGKAQWLVRLTTTTAAARNLANSLARRCDTSWVKLMSGGTEILLIVDVPLGAQTSRSLLLHDIPRTAGITGVSAHLVLHTYHGGPGVWRGHVNALNAAQQQQLRISADSPPRNRALSAAETALLGALSRDGRCGLAELATATGWSPATVTRRLADLRATGALFFDVEFDDAHFGATTQALLWMSVAPAHLDAVATRLAGHDELAFVVATTGSANLVAQAMCPDPAALHGYLTGRLGELEQIRTLETAPVLATIKAGGRTVSELKSAKVVR
ncbi:Lrp/AsnC family transcriptional regulator [Nocardia sp. NPDC051321]|uniref:Lrp/AsnC family transcriptional regulator n=1 Tax=Nocardia sp. NPDC051321 TaxID=3364323 RepID=UPI0037A7FF0E